MFKNAPGVFFALITQPIAWEALMSKSDVFHLGLKKNDLQGATLAIVPGDPARVEKIARLMDNAVHLASQREFTSWRAELDGKAVIVCSTGIGGPSTSIAVEELAQLGIRTFLRVGTTGAIQPDISVGDVLVTTAAVRLDGASLHFAPLEFPAVADFACTTALVDAAKAAGAALHIGVTASSDTFYPGQERYDTFSGRVVRRFQGSMAEWQSMGVLNYEMESATLLTMCASQGLRAGMIAGVIVNRTQQETPDVETMKQAETTVVKVLLDATRRLLAAA
ncbi:Uridine phosphorylase [Brenneria goodwinii]|uniref:Uridine phosphorylase n=2 Tax=Brenneria goodwinii TaxID=1109412 RepID=A0A0G4JTV8_9GAMM|nr:Uridine phosphorylase [Brenneria goodwinii]